MGTTRGLAGAEELSLGLRLAGNLFDRMRPRSHEARRHERMGHAAALRHADGYQQVQPEIGLEEMGQSGRQRVPVRDARLGDLPNQSLGNSGGFDNAAPLCHHARNIDTGGQESAAGQLLDVESNRRFVHPTDGVPGFYREWTLRRLNACRHDAEARLAHRCPPCEIGSSVSTVPLGTNAAAALPGAPGVAPGRGNRLSSGGSGSVAGCALAVCVSGGSHRQWKTGCTRVSSIENTRIRGFRSRADVKVTDLQVAVLIGANGFGKSTSCASSSEVLAWMLRSSRLGDFVQMQGRADDQEGLGR